MAKPETYVALTEAGRRALVVRDMDEIAICLSLVVKHTNGRCVYLDELPGVPKQALGWLLDRRNMPFEGDRPNPELLSLLGDWPLRTGLVSL